MSQNKKTANALARDLADKLSVRFGEASLGVTLGADSNANPTITIAKKSGAWATGDQYVVVRIEEYSQGLGLTNAMGIAQDSFGPHVIQVLSEAALAGTGGVAPSGDSVITVANVGRLLVDLFRTGARVEFYVRANGAQPALADITSTNLVYTADDLYGQLNASA